MLTRWSCILIAFVAILLPSAAGASTNEYRIGPDDVLAIKVLQEDDLTGKYTVQEDGTFPFPLLGRVSAAGLTVREVEESLRQRLASGFLKRPNVSVTIGEYHSLRVFIVGEVRKPGMYAVAGEIPLVELLALAGSTTEAATGELRIVRGRRASDDSATGPAQEVIRTSVDDLQNGKANQDIRVRPGDTVFVPRARSQSGERVPGYER